MEPTCARTEIVRLVKAQSFGASYHGITDAEAPPYSIPQGYAVALELINPVVYIQAISKHTQRVWNNHDKNSHSSVR